MEVVRARQAGACYGVQRALDMAQGTVGNGRSVYTLGPLIHNPQVVTDLARCGVCVADSVDAIRESEAAKATAPSADGEVPAVVVRSHGVTPDVLDAVREAGYCLVDATCPHVARAQRAAAELAREGCRVVVLGEAGHPEVEGLMAWARQAGGKVDVVSGPEDIPEGLYDPIGVVVQTTQRRENLEEVVQALKRQGLSPVVRDTICAATAQRQKAAKELAACVDAMVVIGGRNSSNTTRLAEICADGCVRVHHVESADEIDPAWFADCRRIGVTAGASTPEDQIAAVEERLRKL